MLLFKQNKIATIAFSRFQLLQTINWIKKKSCDNEWLNFIKFLNFFDYIKIPHTIFITTNRLIENKLNQHSFIIEIIFIKDDGLGHQKD